MWNFSVTRWLATSQRHVAAFATAVTPTKERPEYFCIAGRILDDMALISWLLTELDPHDVRSTGVKVVTSLLV